MTRFRFCLFTTITLLTFCENAGAQALSYKVYAWETPQQGWTELSLWNTYVQKSNRAYDQHFAQDNLSYDGLWAHSAEIEYGMTDRFTLGAYADFEDPQDFTAKYVRTRIVGRYRFFNRYERMTNTAVYVEYYVPTAEYSDPEELETRLILERDFEDFRLLLNPIVSKNQSTDKVSNGIELAFAGGIYYRRFYRLQPGIEIFSNFGPANDTLPRDQQRHLLFGTLDINLAPGLTWQLGAATGHTKSSDDITYKSILSWEFGTVRASRQAH